MGYAYHERYRLFKKFRGEVHTRPINEGVCEGLRNGNGEIIMVEILNASKVILKFAETSAKKRLWYLKR